jgi:hypothetical protein
VSSSRAFAGSPRASQMRATSAAIPLRGSRNGCGLTAEATPREVALTESIY